jgi:uncharacterized protein YchJ
MVLNINNKWFYINGSKNNININNKWFYINGSKMSLHIVGGIPYPSEK